MHTKKEKKESQQKEGQQKEGQQKEDQQKEAKQHEAKQKGVKDRVQDSGEERGRHIWKTLLTFCEIQRYLSPA